MFALIIAIVGIIKLNRRRKENKENAGIGSIRFGFGFALLLLAIFIFLYSYGEISAIFTAWATFALALATAFMADESSRLRNQTHQLFEQGQTENIRIRDEDEQIEYRRRSLNEIIDWVQDIRKELFLAQPADSESMAMYQRRLELAVTTSKIAWISKLANIFGSELENSVKIASGTLLSFLKQEKGIDMDSVEKAFIEVLTASFIIKNLEML